MDEEIKALHEEVKSLHQELRQLQFKLQILYNRLQQVQPKRGEKAPLDAAKRDTPSLENFIGLKLIHIVGIIVLLIGISIGVKYAIDRELITETTRIGLAYAAGIVLFFLSERLKKKYRAFSAILFSGGMASLYFTTYAAFVYYALFPFGVAFALMIALTLFTVYQALQYNRQEIGLLGLVGAYAIPFLISSNSGNAVLLFTYIAMINTAVVYLSYKRTWVTLIVAAQAISWLLLLGWCSTRYTVADRPAALIFAGFFFILFAGHALLPKILRSGSRYPALVQQVLCNNMVLYICLQIIFLFGSSKDVVPGVSAFFFLFTAAQAALFFFVFKEEEQLHKQMFLFSIVLLLVYIAHQWNGLLVTFLWLLLAAGLFAAGVMRKATWLRLASIVLIGATLLKLLVFDSLRFTTIQKIISYISLGILLLVVSFFYQKFRDKLFGEKEAGKMKDDGRTLIG